ncbi:antitoxin Xre/MbcA/ParS toxin-binding domain-containing protein [Candidatus Poriferisocius sp.]|uniref:antitoxin Xre/MbcA/ParS toxin-binding domain-containing protein n=1 Tax=Candidatus Poriferisocius sp. TaxID=3101276 RepID=UPI003B5B30D2
MDAEPLELAGTDAGYTYPLVVRAIRSAGLTNAEIARATGVRERQVQNWASGQSRPRDVSRDRLVDVHYLVQQLAEVYKPEGVDIWLHARNRALDGERPIDLLAQGEFKLVLDAVNRLRSGAM